MEKKQTAVEWLVEQLENANVISSYAFLEVIQQAKEMEKEQAFKMPSYDLNELAENAFGDNDAGYVGFKLGFKKAMELITFKSE